MKKIFLILTLFFVFCVNVCAYPSDFFKSYPNGSIKINIDWDKGKGYYNAVFYGKIGCIEICVESTYDMMVKIIK